MTETSASRPEPSESSFSPKVWLAVHGWYHPASETDSYRHYVAHALSEVGMPYEVLRGRALPSGTVAQAVLPLIVRDFVTYGPKEGTIHDLYGDSVFRGVDVSTIQDLFWCTRQRGLSNRLIQLQQLAYEGYRRTLKRSKRVIATTSFLRDELLTHFGPGFREKIRIIPIPCQENGEGVGEHSRFDVLWVGSSLRRKAPLAFVDVIGDLPKDLRIAIRLRRASHLVSDDLNLINQKLAHYRNEGRTVAIFDSEMTREAVARLYRSSRTLVSTSLYEGFHMPVAEAYLRGVNVVLPDAPFYRSTYSSEAGVHWYRGRDQLADTILEGVRSGAFRIDSGFAQRHSYRTVGRALVGTYEEVMRA